MKAEIYHLVLKLFLFKLLSLMCSLFEDKINFVILNKYIKN